jgi:serine/threonine-protein kinase
MLSEQVLDSLEAPSGIATKIQKSNKRSRFFLTLFTFLAIFGGAGAGWWFSSGPGGLAAIPDLTGRSVEAAVEALTPLEVTIEQADESSGSVPVGSITRTDPAAGSRVFKGSVVTVYVSTGPKQLKVPDVESLSLEQARKLVAESGFVAGSAKNFFGELPPGQALGLSATTGSILNEGSVLDILISLGPLPDVAGLSAEQARVNLTGIAIELEELEVFNNDVAAGLVVGLALSQNPLPENGLVTLEISKGPEIVIMPNVVGETIAAAKALLEDLGLLVVVDTNQLSNNFGIAKVKRQTPEAQTQIRVGDSVTIISR